MNHRARKFLERMSAVWTRLTGRTPNSPEPLHWHGSSHSQESPFAYESDSSCDGLVVEFVGGPFDGHCEVLHATERSPRLFIPVSRAILRMLDGEASNWEEPPTSMALYELEKTGGTYWYRFCYPAPPQARSLYLH